MTGPAHAEELPADAVPVVTTDGERLGHVYPVPGDAVHWGTVAARGYRSPFWCHSTQEAVTQLAELAGRPGVACLDTTLTAELARLGELFDPVGVAFAAACLTDRDALAARFITIPKGRSDG